MEPENVQIIPRGKSKLGRYRSLPVPSEWFDYLRPCQVFSGPLKAPLAPDLWGPLNLYLSDLNERLVEVFKLRSGLYDGRVRTLEEVGQKLGVTRERIRQIEKKINQDKLGRELRKAAWDDFREVAERSVWVFRLAGGGKTSWPYSFVARTYGCELVELKTGCWAILRPHLKTNTLTIQIREQPRFYTLEEAEPLTTLNAYELIHTCSAMDGLFVTRGGLVGSYKWTLLEWMQAIAIELAKSGVYEWHFSQMAKLLGWLNPEEYSKMTDRNIAAALARDESQFQNAGLNGVWRLDSLGDGFADTKEAVLDILSRARKPLHHREVYERLARPVRPETLIALLGREPEFLGLGEGFYGLSDQHYLMPPAPRFSSRAVAPLNSLPIPRVSVTSIRPTLELPATLDLSVLTFEPETEEFYIGSIKAVARTACLQDPRLENHLLYWLIELEGIDPELHHDSLGRLCTQAVQTLSQTIPQPLLQSTVERFGHDLAHFIYDQILEYNGVKLHFEVKAADGAEPLRSGLRRTGGSPIEFHAHSSGEADVWLEFGGFERCLYPVQVLGGSDLEVVRSLELGAIGWFRPVRGQFAIYPSETSEEQHQPDFVAEFAEAIYLIDLMSRPEIRPNTLRQAAIREWCHHATVQMGKSWRYVVVVLGDLEKSLQQLR
ncbi:MAG: hypothetical protein IVW51_03945 [Thermaceae bacterium]|nr:hypothetical protein [Thermaceae bacterium]